MSALADAVHLSQDSLVHRHILNGKVSLIAQCYYNAAWRHQHWL